MIFILLILTIVLVCGIWELITISIYGIIKKEWIPYFFDIPMEMIRINQYDPSIIMIDDDSGIGFAEINGSALFKYSVSKYGAVWRFSRLSRQIDKYFYELKLEKLKSTEERMKKFKQTNKQKT